MCIYKYIFMFYLAFTPILLGDIYHIYAALFHREPPWHLTEASHGRSALRYMTLPEGEDLEVSWEDLEVSIINQWLFLVPLKGGIRGIVHPPRW